MMMRKIAAAFGHAKAPKASYVLRHPVRGTQAMIAHYSGRSSLRGRVGLALGTAVALPLAYWAVRSRPR